MELKIPIEIVFDDVNSVIDELGKLQKYKLGEGDDMMLVDVDDVADVLTRHVMAREAKEPCGTKGRWIPCSERLPHGSCSDLVNVSIHDDSGDTPFDYTSCGWVTTDGEYWIVDNEINNHVIAWMPLPKPYGGESDD